MELERYKKAGDILLEIQRTEEILEYFRTSELTSYDRYRLELNGLSVLITSEFYKMLDNFICKRIDELNVKFENL